MQQLTFEIVPHPRSRGDWLLRPNRHAPFGLWYRDREHAISYAEWAARDDLAEILVFNREGILTERRVVGGTVIRGMAEDKPARRLPPSGSGPRSLSANEMPRKASKSQPPTATNTS